MTPAGFDGPPSPGVRADGCPGVIGRFGSLDAFWPLIEPALTHLQPRRICEIGVERGIFTDRLLAWGRENRCAYVGIDPVPAPPVAARVQIPVPGQEGAAANQLLTGRSLEILPGLARCGVYFIDGDHNHHTVRHELELIRQAAAPPAAPCAGPVVFLHDVGWPFGRRDMYHEPAAIPAEARQPYSEALGVAWESDELIDGGLRSPGQYAIATRAGGPGNGVLTAVEDFLASHAADGWRMIKVASAYGLAILYRPEDPSLPGGCRDYLQELHAAASVTGKFLESCEANFLTLYLYSEHTTHALGEQTRSLQSERGAHHQTLTAYQKLEDANQWTLTAYQKLESENHRTLESYRTLEGICQGATAHGEALTQEYGRLQTAYADLLKEYEGLLGNYHDLQRYADQLTPVPATAGSQART